MATCHEHGIAVSDIVVAVVDDTIVYVCRVVLIVGTSGEVGEFAKCSFCILSS